MTLDETELILSASVDQLFFGQTTIGLHDDGDETEIEVEEAYIDALAMPAGTGLRFGRFFSNIGYLNRVHTHAWDFRDAPLVYRAMLGKQYADDGIQLSWLAPTDLYFRVGGETLRGDHFPAGRTHWATARACISSLEVMSVPAIAGRLACRNYGSMLSTVTAAAIPMEEVKAPMIHSVVTRTC